MKHLVWVAALVLLVGAGCNMNNATQDNTPAPAGDTMTEDHVAEETTMETEPMTDEDAATKEEAVVADKEIEVGGEYALSGTTNYAVDKEFFSKPTEHVIGTTPDVSGTLTIVDGAISVDAIIQNTFSTGSGGRDGEVKKLFGGPISVRTNNVTIADLDSLKIAGEVAQTIPLELTIAGTTKTIPFLIQATSRIDGTLVLTGSAAFDMTADFGITPPSLLNVYTVHPATDVTFELVATHV